jgi:hypothetical protein
MKHSDDMTDGEVVEAVHLVAKALHGEGVSIRVKHRVVFEGPQWVLDVYDKHERSTDDFYAHNGTLIQTYKLLYRSLIEKAQRKARDLLEFA